jgi:hypothetical protein
MRLHNRLNRLEDALAPLKRRILAAMVREGKVHHLLWTDNPALSDATRLFSLRAAPAPGSWTGREGLFAPPHGHLNEALPRGWLDPLPIDTPVLVKADFDGAVREVPLAEVTHAGARAVHGGHGAPAGQVGDVDPSATAQQLIHLILNHAVLDLVAGNPSRVRGDRRTDLRRAE